MARKHHMMDNFLSISTPVEEDTLTSDEGFIFKFSTIKVVLHTPITQDYFEVIVEDLVNSKTYLLGKFTIDQSTFTKALDEEDQKWVARNMHYHLKAVVDGNLDLYTLDEWVNVKALQEVLKVGARDLPRDTSFVETYAEVIKWL